MPSPGENGQCKRPIRSTAKGQATSPEAPRLIHEHIAGIQDNLLFDRLSPISFVLHGQLLAQWGADISKPPGESMTGAFSQMAVYLMENRTRTTDS